MSSATQKSPSEQLQLFKRHGMQFSPDTYQKNINSIENIGYYKLKEFAQPFLNQKGRYEHIDFDSVVKRYWQDKNLRLYVLHVIENIEVSLNTEMASVLGAKYGPFGYLNFSSWCNRKLSRFAVEEEQYNFKRSLKYQIEIASKRIQDYREADHFEQDGFPTVWLLPNLLTFGTMRKLFSLMSPANQRQVSAKYHAKPKEMLSWLNALQMVRNICCHNSNVLDIAFKTKLIIPKSLRQYIWYQKKGRKLEYSNKIASLVAVLVYLMQSINPKYQFIDIYKTLVTICDHKEDLAHRLGFRQLSAISEIFDIETKTKRDLLQESTYQYIKKYTTDADIKKLRRLLRARTKKLKARSH